MKGFNFPIFKTKVKGGSRKFRLDDPEERQNYFKFKAGKEIAKLKRYLSGGTFMAFLLGPKNSGKGTYAKLFGEAVGPEYIFHLSVGDAVRNAYLELQDPKTKKELLDFAKKNYRSLTPLKSAIKNLKNKDTRTLLSTELILLLTEREIFRLGKKKAIFIDGFPRSLDQVSYSLFFRALMGYRDDPDFFIFIDVPESVINERMRYRVVCPKCQTPRNIKLLKTKEAGWDSKTKEFYLICDNQLCGKARLIAKEGDELGIESIRERINQDNEVMRRLFELQGVSKIHLRNTVPVDQAQKFIDDYEITPVYDYKTDPKNGQVLVLEEPWVVKDSRGVSSYSLMPAAVGVSLIKQISKILNL